MFGTCKLRISVVVAQSLARFAKGQSSIASQVKKKGAGLGRIRIRKVSGCWIRVPTTAIFHRIV